MHKGIRGRPSLDAAQQMITDSTRMLLSCRPSKGRRSLARAASCNAEQDSIERGSSNFPQIEGHRRHPIHQPSEAWAAPPGRSIDSMQGWGTSTNRLPSNFRTSGSAFRPVTGGVLRLGRRLKAKSIKGIFSPSGMASDKTSWQPSGSIWAKVQRRSSVRRLPRSEH